MRTGNSRLRLGRVLAFGVVAEVAVVLLIVITLTLHARAFAVGQPQSVIDNFAQRAPAVLGPVAGILFTFVASLLATGSMENGHRTHGVLVGLVTALLTLPGLLMVSSALRPLYLAAMILKLFAGLAGGAFSERRNQLNVINPSLSR